MLHNPRSLGTQILLLRCSLLPSAWRVVVLVFHLVDRQRRCASLESVGRAGALERMWYALAQTPKAKVYRLPR